MFRFYRYDNNEKEHLVLVIVYLKPKVLQRLEILKDFCKKRLQIQSTEFAFSRFLVYLELF
ncbi:MAG: hypothetical protein CM15mV8_1760 [Caudoviricetes sp.]|nr:MAG: hypothetical protein CM15mV8_1760 [Caudoviricetes sp.]